MTRPSNADLERLYEAVQSFVRLYQFRDAGNACVYDLTVSECYVLELLAQSHGITVVELAEQLGIHKSNASRITAALAEGGLATKAGHARDKRLAVIHATRKGKALHARIRKMLVARYADALGGNSKADIDAFIDILERLHADALQRIRSR